MGGGFGLAQRADGVAQRLAPLSGSLRHFDEFTRLEHVVKRSIHDEGDVRGGGCRILVFRLGLKLRTRHDVRRAAEIGDKLADRRWAAGALNSPLLLTRAAARSEEHT